MIDERRVCQIEDCAPASLRCEFTVYLPSNRDLMTSPEAEVTLRRIEFVDGSACESDGDHARLVASRYLDPNWEFHLSWPDIQQRVREEFCRGITYLIPARFKDEAIRDFVSITRRVAA